MTVNSGTAPDASGRGLNRRQFLHRASAAALTVSILPVLGGVGSAQIASPLMQLGVRPRADWAEGLLPTGELQHERPEDVKFLLVHHTASANQYDPEDVPGLLRGFYATHTGPAKNWPDVAYNFFVDRFGTLWEGRTGSLARPVMPDATGGSQGFAQLGCFIGDHQAEAPTEAARLAMTALLAALADTYAIETAPGSMITFVSRGSNRWPAGTSVTTTTISGHRDMSQTICPGDAAYDLVQRVFPTDVTALRAATSVPSAPPSAPSSTATGVPLEATDSAGSTAGASAAGSTQDQGTWGWPLPAVTGGVIAAGTAGLVARTLRRRRTTQPSTITDDGRFAR